MSEIVNKINSLVLEGYNKLENENDVVNACEKWIEVWQLIKELRGENIKSIQGLDMKFDFKEKAENWCQDLEMELENAALENEKYFQKRIEYCNEFTKLFPMSSEFIIMSMKTAEAESYFEIGEKEKSENLFKEICEKYNHSVWPYIKWGDTYWLSNIIRKNRDLLDLNKAEEIYTLGLKCGDEEDEHLVKERLQEIQEIRKQLK